ncbi:hypothetical protein CPB83DRAFT_865286 [Crepidotus variabilis]|uniref:Uncharacterized protein n=1 Tax=Crepidotus variabilis TaxID=179855 RepID=A0A9P6E3B5_9AGAR|nr:hypothetical protein CPB83DRAFT_865286 [Crepidotus variabilis]
MCCSSNGRTPGRASRLVAVVSCFAGMPSIDVISQSQETLDDQRIEPALRVIDTPSHPGTFRRKEERMYVRGHEKVETPA